MKRGLKTVGRALDVLAPALAALVALAVGLILGHSMSIWIEGALIVAITTGASTLAALLIAQYFAEHVETVMAGRLGDAARLSLMRPDAAGELWSQEQLCALERTINVDSIWIVGEKFENDTKSPFREVIQYNIAERGVTYVYIAPDLPVIRHQLANLRQVVGVSDADTRFRTVYLKPVDWQRIPYRDGNFTIYTPAVAHDVASGYFWYPGADGASFGRLGERVVNNWAAELEGLLPGLSRASTE